MKSAALVELAPESAAQEGKKEQKEGMIVSFMGNKIKNLIHQPPGDVQPPDITTSDLNHHPGA